MLIIGRGEARLSYLSPEPHSWIDIDNNSNGTLYLTTQANYCANVTLDVDPEDNIERVGSNLGLQGRS